MKPVKVLIVTGAMNAGGAETLIMELLRHKTDRVEYALLIHYAGEKPAGVFDEEIHTLGVPIYYIHSVGAVGEKKYTEELKEINQKYGPFDVLHSHLNGISGAIAKAAKEAGIPARIAHCHAVITNSGNFFVRAKKEALLQIMRAYIDRYANHFWACSQPAAERLYYRKRWKEAVVIPNVINVEAYLKAPSSQQTARQKYALDDELIIGAVGRIAPIKNYEFIIKLVRLLKDQGKNVTFVCFGRAADEAYYQSLLALAKEQEVADQIKFLGNSTNVAEDIHCFDIFVMPSISEGFGIAAIEAQAASIPCIASTGVPKAVDMGVELIDFIDVAQREAWAQRISELAQAQVKTDNENILYHFTQKGFNSKAAVKEIENRYLKMAKK